MYENRDFFLLLLCGFAQNGKKYLSLRPQSKSVRIQKKDNEQRNTTGKRDAAA